MAPTVGIHSHPARTGEGSAEATTTDLLRERTSVCAYGRCVTHATGPIIRPDAPTRRGGISSPTASTLDREQAPLARHTLECVLAASGKAEARPGDQVDDDA